MPVSPWLQKHFDKKWAGKKQIQARLDNLQWKIDPAFLASFERFRTQVLDIVEDAPESTQVVQWEIQTLETKLERVNKKKQLETFDIITDTI